MQWQYSPYVLLLLILAATSAIFVIMAWRRRSLPGAVPLAILGLAAGVWQAGYALELLSDNEPTKVLWAKAQYLGIAAAPTAWLAVALQYTGRGHWLTRRNLLLLAIVPVTTVLLAWTNEAHGLIWSDISLETSDSLLWLVLDHGAWFWAFGWYSYLLLVLGIVLIAAELIHSQRRYWGQTAALIVSALVPWMTNWSFAVGLTPVEYLDLTPVVFAISLLVLLWAFVYAGLLDIVPIAKQLVIDNMNNGVIVLDVLGRIVDWNLAGQRILGRTGVVIGSPFGQVWPDRPDLIQQSADAKTRYVELSLETPDDLRHYEVSVLPVLDRHDRLTGRTVSLTDITERKRVEDERRAMEVKALVQSKLATLGEVAPGIAHEINQPLTYISTMIQATLEDFDLKDVDEERVMHRLSESRKYVGRISEIIDHLRTFGSDEGEMTRVDLGAVLDNTQLILGRWLRQRNVALDRYSEEGLPLVRGNAIQLEQVFIDLIQNAADALSRKRKDARIIVTMASLPQRDQVQVKFSDNGPGIAPQLVERVFLPFFTKSEVHEGTGLGLAIVHGIVQAHGGTIACESTLNMGTTFTITPPAEEGHDADSRRADRLP